MWMFLGPKVTDDFNKFAGKPLDETEFKAAAAKAGFTKTRVCPSDKGHWIYNPYRLNALVDTKTNKVIGFHKG